MIDRGCEVCWRLVENSSFLDWLSRASAHQASPCPICKQDLSGSGSSISELNGKQAPDTSACHSELSSTQPAASLGGSGVPEGATGERVANLKGERVQGAGSSKAPTGCQVLLLTCPRRGVGLLPGPWMVLQSPSCSEVPVPSHRAQPSLCVGCRLITCDKALLVGSGESKDPAPHNGAYPRSS